jgi:hypothetical protein
MKAEILADMQMHTILLRAISAPVVICSTIRE